MSNVKNYFEQGGSDLVIGGRITFEEGAEVVGLPDTSVPDFHVVDLSQMFTMAATGMGFDITSSFSAEEFQSTANSHTPILLKGVLLNGHYSDILLTLSHGGERFIGLFGLIDSDEGDFKSIATVMVYKDSESVVRLRINNNTKLQTLLSDEPSGE